MRPDGATYLVPACDYEEQPISRTYQYRKVMKPMLERKRRARINKCLDELKDLIVSSLQAEGENVSKLEKADILELTVRHLHKLRRQHSLGLNPEVAYADRFRAGFTHCAAEVSQYLAAAATSPTSPLNIDATTRTQLLQHLGSCVRHIDKSSSNVLQTVAAADSCPISPHCYNNAYTPPASPQLQGPLALSATIVLTNDESKPPSSSVWRPW
ncbi:enhancer of split mgamma protein-like [Zootermopsis nevadensis]|uniref:Enhancer of split mgamma protein n=1 Tax=Zootermopsis nevadensis TaxID=136037 RepID=A0A067RJ71_ZOONE|nr:enhancer of split mgamma protein-like [Zootermopsis nevadensis]KDR23063.1 Enhancer of split mgamma protein [Zootermopsis nevadensis]